MGQFLKSETLWQMLGGFALGTAVLVVVSPADGLHTAVKHVAGALGLG